MKVEFNLVLVDDENHPKQYVVAKEIPMTSLEIYLNHPPEDYKVDYYQVLKLREGHSLNGYDYAAIIVYKRVIL